MYKTKTYLFNRNVLKYMKYNAYFTKCEQNLSINVPSTKSLKGDCQKYFRLTCQNFKFLSTSTSVDVAPIDSATFEKVCEETLESLTEYFENLVEDAEELKYGDISYSSGVLTANLGEKFGTYVINRQSPNKQIWLSSPTSGPKRYDFINNQWIYKHDGVSLHQLLQNEISKIVKIPVDFYQCSYSK